MQYDQSLFERLGECGLTMHDVLAISKNLGGRFVDGQVTLVAVNKGNPCQDCGRRHLWVGFVEPKDLPRGLRFLLTRSTGSCRKKA